MICFPHFLSETILWVFIRKEKETSSFSNPPENSQVIWVSIENSIWIPTLEKVGPPGKWWTPWINDGTPPETWKSNFL